jgi:hypothetical protein
MCPSRGLIPHRLPTSDRSGIALGLGVECGEVGGRVDALVSDPRRTGLRLDHPTGQTRKFVTMDWAGHEIGHELRPTGHLMPISAASGGPTTCWPMCPV